MKGREDNMRTLTAHQPNFVPWLPYFRKAATANIFVILINCQYEKNGFQNRFNLGDRWYTMSVGRGLDPICDKEYLNPERDWAKIKSALPQEYAGRLDRFDGYISESLHLTNSAIIMHAAKLLGVSTRIVFDEPTDKRGTARLVELCAQHNCDHYISGPSGRKYLDLSQFEQAGIRVSFFTVAEGDSRPLVEVLDG